MAATVITVFRVWMVYRQDQRIYDDTDCVSTQRKATAFFLFLVGFYVTEDLLQAWEAFGTAKVAACGHLVHHRTRKSGLRADPG